MSFTRLQRTVVVFFNHMVQFVLKEVLPVFLCCAQD